MVQAILEKSFKIYFLRENKSPLKKVDMKTYENKEKLKEAISQAYIKFDKEFDEVAEALKDSLANGIDRTPAQILAYQVG